LPKGVASCRNLGIENARGGWISFLDSDDLFLPGKIAGTIDLIHQYGGACSAYFHTVRQFEDGSNKTLSTTNDAGPAGPADIFPELLKKNIITTSSVTIKKSLLNELGGFDINLHGVEDYMLWLRVAKMTKWLWSDNVWTDYRVRATSLMGGRKMTHYVTQSAQLLKSARSLGEFTNEELKKLEYSVFYLTLEYYALVSLNTGGWRDLLKGLAALVRIGKGKLALRIFRRHFKNLMLKKTHSYLKGANKTAR
jgi:glycosyltransferase involved in cell wall biosynthesis